MRGFAKHKQPHGSQNALAICGLFFCLGEQLEKRVGKIEVSLVKVANAPGKIVPSLFKMLKPGSIRNLGKALPSNYDYSSPRPKTLSMLRSNSLGPKGLVT